MDAFGLECKKMFEEITVEKKPEKKLEKEVKPEVEIDKEAKVTIVDKPIPPEERDDFRQKKSQPPLPPVEKSREPYIENSRYKGYRDYPTPGGSTGSDLGYGTTPSDLSFSSNYSQNSTPATNYDFYNSSFHHPPPPFNSFVPGVPPAVSSNINLPIQQPPGVFWAPGYTAPTVWPPPQHGISMETPPPIIPQVTAACNI